MAYAELAYRYSTAAPQIAPRTSERSKVRVVPGSRPEQAPASAAGTLVALAAAVAALLVVAALIGCVRVALASATVSTMIQSDTVSAQISEARSEGTALEMKQASLTSDAALKSAQKRLGMAAPAEVGAIVLDEDVVAVDAQGALSLSGTIDNIVQAKE
jgi:hypothetical protein